MSAPEIEALVQEVLQPPQVDTPGPVDQPPSDHPHTNHLASVERIVLQQNRVDIHLRADTVDKRPRCIAIAWTPATRQPRVSIISPTATTDAKPIRSETRARLLQGVANARAWLDELIAGEVDGIHALAEREGCSERHIRMTLNLAFLSPTIIEAALDGTLPAGSGIIPLMDSSALWACQKMQALPPT